ncbi:MAG: glycosyltransferase family 2 protein [Candidatus Competibacterales bacterium]|nr:glycosyltransferase family 2 protein [Candidatus Competibacterales bacterium]
MPASTLVLIPARNEAATVAEIVAAAHGHGVAEVVVIDDASTDDTAVRAQVAGARVLPLAVPLGAWGAIQTGLRYARDRGAFSVITMDADGQHRAEDIVRLLQLLRAGDADVVIGADPARVSRARRLAWRWFRMLTRFGLEDVTSGFRAYNPRAVRLLAGPEASLLDYQDIGVLLLLTRRGLRIREIPVAMNARRDGKSRVFSSWLVVARYMFQTSLLCLARIGHHQARPAPRVADLQNS